MLDHRPDTQAAISLGIVLTTAILLAGSLACGGSGGGNPTQPPPDIGVLVGVVGCSQTTTAWEGWLDVGDGQVWSIQSGYGGGDIAQWARSIPSGKYWSRLNSNIAANGAPTAIWWQICDLLLNNGTTADAEAVVDEILRRLPGVTIFVSPLANFEKPETCTKQDIENSRMLASHIVNSGKGRPGPELPTVLDAWIQPPAGDGGCHVGDEGSQAFGATLASFDWD